MESAFEWILKAAVKIEEERAQFQIASCFEHGQGNSTRFSARVKKLFKIKKINCLLLPWYYLHYTVYVCTLQKIRNYA